MVLISVVMPVYNVEDYVEKCIKSILNQSFSKFELIIVNDGSTDHSYEICKKYAKSDHRIRLINKKNGGLVSSWKVGARESKGECIAFVDSDDYIEKKYLENLYSKYKEFKVELVMAPVKKKKNEEIYNIEYKLKPGFYDYEELKKKVLPNILNDNGLFQSRILLPNRWGKLIARKLVLKNMKYVDEKTTYAEDLNLLIPIFLDLNSIYVAEGKEDSYIYRIRNNSMVRGYDKNRWTSVKLVYTSLYRIYNEKNLGPQFLNQLCLDYLSSIIQCYKNEIKKRGNNFKRFKRFIFEMRQQNLFKMSINRKDNFSLPNKMLLKVIKKSNVVEDFFLYWLLKAIFNLKMILNPGE